jgi:hypothetical protein
VLRSCLFSLDRRRDFFRPARTAAPAWRRPFVPRAPDERARAPAWSDVRRRVLTLRVRCSKPAETPARAALPAPSVAYLAPRVGSPQDLITPAPLPPASMQESLLCRHVFRSSDDISFTANFSVTQRLPSRMVPEAGRRCGKMDANRMRWSFIFAC